MLRFIIIFICLYIFLFMFTFIKVFYAPCVPPTAQFWGLIQMSETHKYLSFYFFFKKICLAIKIEWIE